MIYEMARDVAADLAARKYPVAVSYGPERVTRDGYPQGVIVVERDRDGSDAVTPPKGQVNNPRYKGVRTLAVKATIYARSSLDGPLIGDHERECEKLVDAFIVALEDWGTESKAGYIAITAAKYLDASARADTEQWPGVIYELRFAVPRGVYKRDYVGENNAGDARPTGAPGSFQNKTNVRLAHAPVDEDGNPIDPPEIGCDGTDP